VRAVAERAVPTRLEVAGVIARRVGPLVRLWVIGRLVDARGLPVAFREVEVAVGDGEPYRAYAETNVLGVLQARVEGCFPPLRTRAAVAARLSGDGVYQGSEDVRVVRFPPSWEVVRAAAAVAAAATAAALLSLL